MHFAKLTILLCTLLFFCASTVLPTIACATCGCSEICPIAMMESGAPGRGSSILSDSIWGNIILKMAYQHDPQLQSLRKKVKFTDAATTDALLLISSGTLAQTTTSLALLNPPEGFQDSYTPGIIGLTLDAATNLTFGGRVLLNLSIKKKIRKRQLAVRNEVEAILHHLEFSQTKCQDAQSQLAQLIGDKGASECLQLWQSSHTVASGREAIKTSDGDIESGAADKAGAARLDGDKTGAKASIALND